MRLKNHSYGTPGFTPLLSTCRKFFLAYPLLTVLSMDKQLSRANKVVKACCMNSGVCGAAAARARCGCGAGAAQTAAIS